MQRLVFLVAAGVLATACTWTTEELPPEPTTAALSASSEPSDSAQGASLTTRQESTSSSTAQPDLAPERERREGLEDAVPATANDMAEALAEAEMAIRTTNGEDSRAWGRRQQLLYRVLANHPEWAPDVIASVDPGVRFAVEKNWTARQELSSLVTSTNLSDTLPAWRIRDPLPLAQLLGYYADAEAATGIEWEYLAAINLIETRMGRIEGLSTAGATGPMQFLPSTWEECCQGDPTIDRDAITGAGVYLALSGGPADMPRALRRYNNSEYYVKAVTAYASVLQQDPDALSGYHAWQVYFLSSAGLIVLPEGYEEPVPVPAQQWLKDHPEALAIG